jgi:diguanylate cyclase (GGDEF)-like protein/PAS domain S-box-containing protein
MNGQPAIGPSTVLVVEDNPGDARLVSIYLQEDAQVPFRIVHAVRLSEALAVFARQHVDVVLLDLSLPDSFGLDTLARLRAAQPLVPIVVLTGTNDEILALEALRRGAEDYLVKGQGGSDLVRRATRYAIERSRVDQELRRSEARFRAIFANAGIGVVLLDPAGHFIECNPAFRAMMGYSEDELKAMTFGRLGHPEDGETEDATVAEVLAGRLDSANCQRRYVAKGGGVLWVTLTATAVRDEENGEIRFAVAVIEDITERKRLEDHMRLTATVFENTGEGLFITDAQRHIIHVNRAFTDITGYTAAEVLGRNPSMLASGRHEADFYAAMWSALNQAGRWQGEIWDRRKSGEMFAGWQNIAAVRDGNGQISHFVAVISDITSRKEVEERLSYAANHDPLTRLPNRTLFQERLSRALARAQRNQEMVAVLFIDLDHFKEVNDTQGHLAGDRLLQQVAERISRSIRQGDTVARLAGDEFTVILEDIQDPRDAAFVAHKILRILAQPYDLIQHTAKISASIGVAIYPTDADDSQTLVTLADTAMYRAKQSGRNGCQFHSEVVNAQAFERMVLEDALRGAIERQELSLLYQPIFETGSGRVVAVEALLRWTPPDIGMLLPAQFLPLAEESGQIMPIGAWVLETACRQMAHWHALGLTALDLDINLSARQLRHPDLVDSIAGVLESTGLVAGHLVLEVPESCVTERGHDSSVNFSPLVALGVQVAIDEFGSGYSSFTLLRRLPANTLKIAQSFIHNMPVNNDDTEIVRAIMAVAGGLHLSVVAPGIETQAQLDQVLSCACARVQGFLLARPMGADAMTDYLVQRTRPAVLVRRPAIAQPSETP